MNYKHVYHAGNFADVFKHVTLTALLLSLERKDTPFCYIDTHAGSGFYDLFSEFASKTKEYEHGIEKIIQKEKPPSLIKRYLDCIHQINNELTQAKFASLRYYPGSPLIARHLIRAHDRIVACELQRNEYEALRHTFAGDKQVAIHHMDGFSGLKAFLPPKEKRGLVLIDPPYEDPDEYMRIAHSLPLALKRWAGGIYAIWHPIKEKSQVDRFYRVLKEGFDQPIFVMKLTIHPDIPNHLNGCGMVIINPPWQFDTDIVAILPWLWESLSINQQGEVSAYFL